MYNSIRTFSFLFGYLPFTLLKLKKVKKLSSNLEPSVKDVYADEVPMLWASGIMKRTKSEITVKGIENLPYGAVLIISNHEGNFDIPTLISSIPKPFGFISKIEVKKLPIINDWMEQMNCVFLDRSDRRSTMNVLRDSIEKLQQGHSLLVFPEGTRSKGEGIKTFKSGFAKIAQEAGVPILPIAIQGTSAIMEKNNNWIKPAKVTVEILPVIPVDTIMGMSRKDLIEYTEEKIATSLQSS